MDTLTIEETISWNTLQQAQDLDLLKLEESICTPAEQDSIKSLGQTQDAYQVILESALSSTDLEGPICAVAILRLASIVNTASVDEYEQTCYGICMEMIEAAYRAPDRIDDLLCLYFKTADLASKPKELPRGDLMDQLAMNIREFGHSRYRDLEFWAPHTGPRPPGDLHSADASNVNFSEVDVRDDLQGVLKVMKRQTEAGNKYMTELVMCGRFEALTRAGKRKSTNANASRANGKAIGSILAKTQQVWTAWNQVEFVGMMLRLRGVAKSLFSRPGVPEEESQQMMKEWQDLLKRWLWDSNLNVTNNQVVKQHAFVSTTSSFPIITL